MVHLSTERNGVARAPGGREWQCNREWELEGSSLCRAFLIVVLKNLCVFQGPCKTSGEF